VGGAGVEVRGVTASGPGEGVKVKTGGELTLVDSLLDGNFNVGLDLETTPAAAHLLRSVIRGTLPKDDVSGYGAEVIFGATLDLVDSAIVGSAGGAILMGEDGTHVTITNSVVRDTAPDLNGLFGYGINARNNAAMDITRSVFVANTTGAVRISKGATATVTESVMRDTQRDATGLEAFGFIVVDGAKLTATKIAATGNEGGGIVTLVQGSVSTITDSVLRAQLGNKGKDPSGDLGNGAYVFSGGRLEITGTAIVDNHRSGIDAYDMGTVLALSGSLITGTTSSLVDKMGMGVEIALSASGTIKDSAITHNLHTGIFVYDGATVDVSTSVIRDTKLQVFQTLLGHGLLAQDSPHVTIGSSEFDHNAGVGLAFSNSSATIRGTSIVGNAIGIHAQDGSTLKDVDDASGDPAGLDILVAKDTIFTGNGAKTGSGLIPLPMPIPPSRP
ncbi:MAG: right-handed parallel beta-helix repeat-containing protein, partial [Polyangiaceae bacterium]